MRLFLIIVYSWVLWAVGNLLLRFALPAFYGQDKPPFFGGFGFLLLVWSAVSVVLMMRLFSPPAWKSKNEERALRSVEKMTDQEKLARVAKEAEYREVHKTAVALKIARNHHYRKTVFIKTPIPRAKPSWSPSIHLSTKTFPP
ncbi:MAG: hypothetical protein LBS59_03250 [Puniceicoccales bacterium]|jgi:hypothetical protein|nr:hypothetical protein [Puniceicoccales bacterium]